MYKQALLFIGLTITSLLIPATVFGKTLPPPSILSLHVASSNSNPAYAKPGDTVTVSFTTNEAVTPIVLANTRTILVKSLNNGGNSWSAAYPVSVSDQAGTIAYLITLVDSTNNKNIYICSSVKLPLINLCPSDGSSVTVDKTAPAIGAVAFTSPMINAALAGAAPFTVAGPSGESDTVAYVISDTKGNKVSGTGVTANGLFKGTANISSLLDGTLTLTASISDAAGNQSAQASATATKDATPPVISAQAGISATATDPSGIVVSYTLPTATDARDGTDPVSCTPISGSLFPVGATTVNCSAKDAAGNTSSSSFMVTVTLANPAPTATLSANPTTITSGQPSTLSWSSTNATSCTGVGFTASGISGSIPVSPTADTTYTITCTGAGGTSPVASAAVIVTPPSQPSTTIIATQPDQSFFCTPNWTDCFTGGAPRATINLGLGSSLGSGTLQSVTIAKDATSSLASQPWGITIDCYTNSTYSTYCPDWIKPTVLNNATYYVVELATSTTDNEHWTAYFTNPANESNSDGSFPVKFNPNYYYQLVISSQGYDIGAYGSQSLGEPYFVINGLSSQ